MRDDGVVAGVVDGHVEQGVVVLVPGLELPGSDYCRVCITFLLENQIIKNDIENDKQAEGR